MKQHSIGAKSRKYPEAQWNFTLSKWVLFLYLFLYFDYTYDYSPCLERTVHRARKSRHCPPYVNLRMRQQLLGTRGTRRYLLQWEKCRNFRKLYGADFGCVGEGWTGRIGCDVLLKKWQADIFVMQAYTYPENIGMPFSNDMQDMYVLIEMHYNNQAQFQKGMFRKVTWLDLTENKPQLFL